MKEQFTDMAVAVSGNYWTMILAVPKQKVQPVQK